MLSRLAKLVKLVRLAQPIRSFNRSYVTAINKIDCGKIYPNCKRDIASYVGELRPYEYIAPCQYCHIGISHFDQSGIFSELSISHIVNLLDEDTTELKRYLLNNNNIQTSLINYIIPKFRYMAVASI